MSESWDVEKVVRMVEERLKERQVLGVVEQGEAVGVNRETLRRTLARETTPSPKTMKALLDFLALPVPGPERDDGIRYAVERMQEALDELMRLTRSPEDDLAAVEADDGRVRRRQTPGGAAAG